MPRRLKCFKIDADLDAALRQLAVAEHEAESTLIRRAIRQFLERTGALQVASRRYEEWKEGKRSQKKRVAAVR
jgi:predicted transcriptional regulator